MPVLQTLIITINAAAKKKSCGFYNVSKVCTVILLNQDYFGEAMSDTNSARGLMYLAAQALDKDTNNGEWTSEFKRYSGDR